MKDREVLTTNGAYHWSFVTQIFHNDQPSHGWRSYNFRSDSCKGNDFTWNHVL